jgi:outer membrane immunogenic protein
MKKSIYAALAIAGVMCAPVHAADIPAKAPAYQAPAVVPLTWRGFYVGGTLGYGFGESEHFASQVPGSSTGNFDIDGFVGGFTIGYNWQFSAWVLGIEADWSFADLQGSVPGNPSYGCGAGNSCQTDVRWFGTVRGRLGYAFGPWLPYVTGGFAYGDVEASIPSSGPAFTKSSTLSGWTAGAGFEYAFSPRWSAKLEWLYVDLGDFSYAFTFVPLEAKAEFSVIRGGINYRW